MGWVSNNIARVIIVSSNRRQQHRLACFSNFSFSFSLRHSQQQQESHNNQSIYSSNFQFILRSKLQFSIQSSSLWEQPSMIPAPPNSSTVTVFSTSPVSIISSKLQIWLILVFLMLLLLSWVLNLAVTFDFQLIRI